MSTEAEDARLEFEVRSAIYQVLARLMQAPPDQPLLRMIGEPGFLEEWPWGRGNPRVEAGLELLLSSRSNLSEEVLTREYQDLFWGPGPVLAPPWESVYLDREHLLFGEDTLRVREMFRRFGLESEQLDREPDDHIGLQLQFLFQLSSEAAHRLEAGDFGSVRQLVEGQRECLEGHLLRWIDPFVERVLLHGRSDFYKGVALLVRGTLGFDHLSLQNLIATPIAAVIDQKEE